ncbi:hypothetical protein D3C81_07560 [compost metagenome]
MSRVEFKIVILGFIVVITYAFLTRGLINNLSYDELTTEQFVFTEVEHDKTTTWSLQIKGDNYKLGDKVQDESLRSLGEIMDKFINSGTSSNNDILPSSPEDFPTGLKNNKVEKRWVFDILLSEDTYVKQGAYYKTNVKNITKTEGDCTTDVSLEDFAKDYKGVTKLNIKYSKSNNSIIELNYVYNEGLHNKEDVKESQLVNKSKADVVIDNKEYLEDGRLLVTYKYNLKTLKDNILLIGKEDDKDRVYQIGEKYEGEITSNEVYKIDLMEQKGSIVINYKNEDNYISMSDTNIQTLRQALTDKATIDSLLYLNNSLNNFATFTTELNKSKEKVKEVIIYDSEGGKIYENY